MQQQDMEAIIRAMEQSDPNTREAARKIRSAMGTQEGLRGVLQEKGRSLMRK